MVGSKIDSNGVARASSSPETSRRRTVLLGFLMFLVFALPGASAFGAPFSNAGFEDGVLDPWYQNANQSEGEDWNVTMADAHSGSWSATDIGNKEIRQDFDGILVELVLEVSFWMKRPDGTSLIAYNLYYDDGSFTQFFGNLATSDWELVDVTSNLAAGKKFAGIGIFGHAGGCPEECSVRTYVDDVTVSVVPEPTSVALVGLGLLCMAATRRSRGRARAA